MREFPFTEIIRIESLPKISEVLSSLYRQMQFAGLLCANFYRAPRDGGEDVPEQLTQRLALLETILSVVETQMREALTLSGVPAISNRGKWADPKQLGGYTGLDLKASGSDIIGSYLGCWQHGFQYPKSLPGRFVRLAFWYWRKTGNVLNAMGLLLDLYQAGFMIQEEAIEQAFLYVANAYTKDFDLGLLKQLDFSNEDANEAIHDAVTGRDDAPHDATKAQKMAEWLLDRALSESDTARHAASLDEWMIAKARLRATVQALRALESEHHDMLTGVQRAMASQFEEITADLGGESVLLASFAKCGRPLIDEMLGIGVVALDYQRRYGAKWLDPMLEDRVLAPDALRETIQAAYANRPLESLARIDLPREWKFVSPLLAWPLCAAFKRDQPAERCVDFSMEDVRDACQQLGFQPKADGNGKDYRDEDQAQARRKLSAQELRELFSGDVFERTSKNPGDGIAHFEKAAETFPYCHFIELELGIRNDQSGKIEEGYRHTRAAVLLDPTDELNWKSFGIVLQRMGHPRDAVFAKAVFEMIHQREDRRRA